MKKVFWLIFALLLLSVAANVWLAMRGPQVETTVEHDTIWKDTTIYQPQPAETINTGRVVYISIPFPGERDTLRDTIRDSIDVPIPIIQKRYDDSLYTAWISGFEPNLDSLRLHQPEIITTITKVVDRPASRFSIGPSVGLGYGVMNKQCDVFIGVTATWSLTK
jgi:hypothetical protein